jgi:hypothetical protein
LKFAPKVPQQISPGQRPGFAIEPDDLALKGNAVKDFSLSKIGVLVDWEI